MTIDIIEAAKADRQTKAVQLETCREQVRQLTDQAIRLQLDVIEIDQFIAKARSYAGDGETNTTAPKPLPEDQGDSATESIAPEHRAAEAKTVDQEPLSNGSGGVQDGLPVHPANPIPTIPQPQEGEETSTVAEPAPVKAEPSQYDKVVAVLRENRDATIREICELAGVPRGTASVYRGKALAELYPHKPPRKPGPVAEPVAAPFQTTTRNIPVGPAKRPSGKTTFRLRNDEGLYLHSDLNAMLRKGLRFVSKRDYPWTGTEQQMLAVRKMLPETIDLKEEVIQP